MGSAARPRLSSPEDAERAGVAQPARRHVLRTYLATRALPWFVLGALLVIVGSFALRDPTESYVVVGGMGVLFAACVRYTILAVRDDPLRSLIVARRGLLGWMATESAGGRRRRARRRAAAQDAEMHYEARSTCGQRRRPDQSGYSSLRQTRGSSDPAFGVRWSRNEWYGATNGSGAITV